MIKTVLLAIDLSVFTPCLLQHAADLANRQKASLVVVHAVEPIGNLGHALLNAYLKPETTKALTTTGINAMVNEVKTQIIDALTEECIENELGLEALGQVIVKAGSPVDVILEAAEECNADIIVLGSNSPASSVQPGLGTVAQKILHNSKVPAYVVPNTPLATHQIDTQHQMRLW